VFLYNLDDLAKIAEANRTARVEEIERCRVMLAHRADSLWTHIQQYLASGQHDQPAPTDRAGGPAGEAAAP